jgi:acyl-CoA dehydrogenase
LREFRRLVADACRTAGDSRALWRELGQSGVLAELGGRPRPELLGQLLEELDERLPGTTVLAMCVQVAAVVPLLHDLAAVSPLAAAVLDEATNGKSVVALAATDAGVSGSALLDATTAVAVSATDMVLRGGKDWIANACSCDYALVLARHRPARHFTSFSWVLVPADASGVSIVSSGTRFPDVGHLRFHDVTLSTEHLVGRRGRAMAEFVRHAATERLAGALWARALCRRVLTDCHHRLTRRSTGEGALWDNAAIRARFAECLVEWRCLDALCAPSGRPVDGMVLKAVCGQAVNRIVGECADLAGADAFADGGVAGLRDLAAMFGIAGGATGTMLAGVADHAEELLRRPGTEVTPRCVD